MKRIPQIYAFALVCILLLVAAKPGNDGASEGFLRDYRKILQVYQQHKSMEVDVKYSLYGGSASSKKMLTEKGKIKRAPGKLYIKYFGYEMLETDRYSISVDHRNHYIFFTHKGKDFRKQEKKSSRYIDPDFAFKLLDSVSSRLKNVKLAGKEGDIITYSLELPDMQDMRVLMSYHTNTYLITKMVIYPGKDHFAAKQLGQGARVEVEYTRTDINPVFTDTDFNIYDFVSREDGKYIPASRFSTYKLQAQ